MMTGDMVSGQRWDGVTDKYWHDLINPVQMALNKAGIPYGITAGYHDFETDVGSEAMIRDEEAVKVSHTQWNHYRYRDQPLYHQFTYTVPIHAPDDPSDDWFTIWVFGTGRANCMGLGGMDCIRRDQIAWYREESQKFEKENGYPGNGMAFMHHALQEHMYLYNSSTTWGQKRDNSSCQAVNTGLFAAMKEAGNVQWVSAGADHSTDFWGTYAGINLSYGRKTGIGSYGPKFVQPGARIFNLRFNESSRKVEIDTYIHERDGTQVDQMDSQNNPMAFSFLKNDHCYGSEEVMSMFSTKAHSENGWIPEFLS